MDQPLTIRSWPRAIVHVDADAFFASCEQAVRPGLRGRPVITGKERGIVAAASYEAKARGVERGMRLSEVKRVCPDAVVLPSDYETYSLFSLRLFGILRRFSPDVEEYSIDEAFVDLTGLRREHHGSYAGIAAAMQETVARELGITISAGVSVSKVLAKIGSKYRKPRGLTVIPGRDIHLYLKDMPAGKVWGIGSNTAAWLRKSGVETALDFASKDERFVMEHCAKPLREIWHELNGRSVYPVVTERKDTYQSISKARTFTPPSGDGRFVFGQLSRNLENACIKARRHRLAATRLVVILRTQDFRDSGVEIKLSRPTSYPAELFGPLREGFEKLFLQQVRYRQTVVVLGGLMSEKAVQHSLFDDVAKIERMARLYDGLDELSARFGKHTLMHGASLSAARETRHKGDRGDAPDRVKDLFQGENARQHLGLPVVRISV